MDCSQEAVETQAKLLISLNALVTKQLRLVQEGLEVVCLRVDQKGGLAYQGLGLWVLTPSRFAGNS